MGLFGKIKELIWWNKLGLQLAEVVSLLKKDALTQGVSVGIVLKKGGVSLLKSALAVLGVVFLAFLGDDNAVTSALKAAHWSDVLIAACIPFLHSLLTMYLNYQKHRDDPSANSTPESPTSTNTAPSSTP